ncbi:MAG: ATP synthase subunit I [Candidatus Acidiferrales bacterium]
MTTATPENPDDAAHIRISRRIAWLILVLGFLGAAAVFVVKSRRAGAGIAIGTFLSWLNFRWLDQSLGVVATVTTAKAGTAQARTPASFYWKIGGRYVLIAAVIYVTVHYFAVPLLSELAGLLSLGAGAIVGSLYEVFRGLNNE